MTKCRFCGKEGETREGGCWKCAEAESIIEEGLDMYDKGIGGEKNVPAVYAGQKLKMLIDKGWTFLTNYQRQKIEK